MSDETTIRRSLGGPRRGRTDWARLERQSDQEIAVAVAANADAAPLVDEAWFRLAQVVEPPPRS